VTCTWGRDQSSYYYRYPETSYPTAPVPSKLSFTYQPDAVARFGMGSRMQADDGWSDVPTGDGLSVSRSTAKRLYSQDANGQSVITVTLPVGKADSWLTSSPTGSNTSASAEVYVVVGGFTSDNRGVRIIRNSAPSAKLDGDSTLNKDHDEWVEADGTGHGHTRYSYYESDAAGGNPVLHTNTQNFTANRFGYWGANLSWLWEPGGNPSAASGTDSNTMEMTTGSLYKDSYGDGGWKGSPTSPTTPLYTYTLREDGGDGAKATAKYYLTLHDEFEKNYPDNVIQAKMNPRPVTPSVEGGAAFDGDPIALYVEHASGWTVEFSPGGPLESFIAKQLGLTPGVSYQAQMNVGVGETVNDARADEGTYLEQYDLVKLHTGFVDSWTSSGYAGQVPYRIIEPDYPYWRVQAHRPLIYRPTIKP